MRTGGKSLTKNIVYQTLYNILSTITPLITTPIISREMGSNGLGIFSYTLTVSHYFTLFAMLGIVNYGTRAIAETQKTKAALSQTFFSIYAIQFTMAAICNVAYLAYVFLLAPQNKTIFLLQGFWVLATLFDINWLFFGLEEFRITVTRSIIIKILTVTSIILFVREEHNPLFVYTLIMAGGQLVSMIAVLPLLRNRIGWFRPGLEQIKPHIKPILVLFIPLLSGVLFGSMDRLMLGNRGEYDELGYYYNADRIINIPVSIINGVSTVLFPRVASLLSAQKEKEGLGFISKSFELVAWSAALLALGIAGCAKEFVPVFFGAGFDKCVELIYIMTPILILNAICIFYRMQYLVPMHHDKLYAVALFVGTGVNVLLNALLIPKYKAVGAAIATLVAQFVVMVVQMKEHKDLDLGKWCVYLMQYLVLGALMFGAMRLTAHLISDTLTALVVEIAVGGTIFLLISVLFWKATGQLNEKIRLLKR